MNRFATILAGGLVAALITSPILAQRGGDRPSRECRQEVVKLCGTDRSQIRSCLQERISELSESCAAEIQKRARNRGSEGRRSNRGQRQSQFQPAAKVDRTIIYGQHQRQQIDVYEPDDAVDELPLVLFVHGGGWSFGNHKISVQSKPDHFNEAGYYFASTGYRVLPDAPVEDQAKDIGAALMALRGQASAIGFDRDRIVLMGHSAGAHLAALVASDPQYAGDAFDAIKGVVLLDSGAYEITSSLASAEPRSLDLYRRVFGEDQARQTALSPVTHAGGPDAPNWLALYVEEREKTKAQAEALVSALSSTGANAQAVAVSNTDHGRLNREIGTAAGTQQTQAVDAFLSRIFAG